MTNITAKMAHSKESVELMCITQYNTFEFGKKIALLVISAALIVFGVRKMSAIDFEWAEHRGKERKAF